MSKRLKTIATTAIAVLSLNTYAAVDMFLGLAGIEGESQDSTYGKQIDVLAWFWGMSQSGTTHVVVGGGAGIPSFANISVTKWIDSSSTSLRAKLATGGYIENATLTMRKAGDAAFVFEQIVMYNIIVSSTSMGGSGGEDRLTENVTLNFEAFCLLYTEQTPSGGTGAKPRLCWNIAAKETCSTAQVETLYNLPLVMSLPRHLKVGLTPICSDT